MTDELTISGIECFGHHGVFELERRTARPSWSISPSAWTPAPRPTSDDLRHTVDYGSLVAAVQAAVQTDPVDLIETLAQRIATLVLLEDRVEWARVRCTSRMPPSRRRSRRRADDYPET